MKTTLVRLNVCLRLAGGAPARVHGARGRPGQGDKTAVRRGAVWGRRNEWRRSNGSPGGSAYSLSLSLSGRDLPYLLHHRLGSGDQNECAVLPLPHPSSLPPYFQFLRSLPAATAKLVEKVFFLSQSSSACPPIVLLRMLLGTHHC
jgi:hypothetical protein